MKKPCQEQASKSSSPKHHEIYRMSATQTYLLTSNDAARQYINARQAFLAIRDAQREAKQVRGSMYWYGAEKSIAANPTN